MAKFVINTYHQKSKINKEIYGHFSEHLGRCIYGGIFVGKDSPLPNIDGIRTDVLEALKKIRVPALRWPGGCFADTYHFLDGIGPLENRKKMINTHWGGVVEDNSFGTHEFMRLCELLGCEPYINLNVGSGTVEEAQNWIEYMTSGEVSPMAELRRKNGQDAPWALKYVGVGNESWGCGGNMTPEYYSNEYRRYGTYVRNYSGNRVYKIACGANSDDYNWTDVLMKNAGKQMHGLSLHYYTVPHDWKHKGSATEFDAEEYYLTLRKAMHTEELLERHSKIMDRYDPGKKVGLIFDEWGTWYDVEPGTNPGFLYQQNTMRDAMVAGMHLNMFNKHSDRVFMANIAQTVNVLQAVILTEGEKIVLTPTYHIFDLYQIHQDARLVDSFIQTSPVGGENAVPSLSESVSVGEDGRLNITLCNLSHDSSEEIDAIVVGMALSKVVSARIVAGEIKAFNNFDAPERVTSKAFTGVSLTGEGLKLTLPPCSAVAIVVE